VQVERPTPETGLLPATTSAAMGIDETKIIDKQEKTYDK
jgi:hypothetical protein